MASHLVKTTYCNSLRVRKSQPFLFSDRILFCQSFVTLLTIFFTLELLVICSMLVKSRWSKVGLIVDLVKASKRVIFHHSFGWEGQLGHVELQISQKSRDHSLAKFHRPFLSSMCPIGAFKLLMLMIARALDANELFHTSRGSHDAGGLLVRQLVDHIFQPKHALVASYGFKVLTSCCIAWSVV